MFQKDTVAICFSDIFYGVAILRKKGNYISMHARSHGSAADVVFSVSNKLTITGSGGEGRIKLQ